MAVLIVKTQQDWVGKALPAECQTLIAFPHLMMLLVAVMMNYLTHISHIYDDAHILLQVRVILLALHNSFLCCRCASFLPNMFISRQICPILYPTKMSKLILLPHLTFKTHLSIKIHLIFKPNPTFTPQLKLILHLNLILHPKVDKDKTTWAYMRAALMIKLPHLTFNTNLTLIHI